MAKTIDTRLLMMAAEVGHNWSEYREDFAKFAKPFWMKQGGEGLVSHMMNKYVNNDQQSIVEYIYNLGHINKEIVAKWLLSKVEGYPESAWTVFIEED